MRWSYIMQMQMDTEIGISLCLPSEPDNGRIPFGDNKLMFMVVRAIS